MELAVSGIAGTHIGAQLTGTAWLPRDRNDVRLRTRYGRAVSACPGDERCVEPAAAALRVRRVTIRDEALPPKKRGSVKMRSPSIGMSPRPGAYAHSGSQMPRGSTAKAEGAARADGELRVHRAAIEERPVPVVARE